MAEGLVPLVPVAPAVPTLVPRIWGNVNPDAIISVMKCHTRVGSKGRGEMSMAPLTYPTWEKLSTSQKDKIVKIFNEQSLEVQTKLVNSAIEDQAAGRRPKISQIKRKLQEIRSHHQEVPMLTGGMNPQVNFLNHDGFMGAGIMGDQVLPQTTLAISKSSDSAKIEALTGLVAHSKSAKIRLAAEKELCRIAGISYSEN